MDKYISKSIELRKHVHNAISYIQDDTTEFPLENTVAFFKGFLAGLEKADRESYDSWLKEQEEAVS
jgi:hypothetical protein